MLKNKWIRVLGLFVFVAFISLGTIGGCGGDDGGEGMLGEEPTGKSHTITFVNNCNEPIWIAARSNGQPLQSAPPWGPNGEATWKLPPADICCTDDTAQMCNPVLNGCTTNADCMMDSNTFTECVANTDNSRSLIVGFCKNAVFNARTGCVDESIDQDTLICNTADCNGKDNCGTNGAGAEPSTQIEMNPMVGVGIQGYAARHLIIMMSVWLMASM